SVPSLRLRISMIAEAKPGLVERIKREVRRNSRYNIFLSLVGINILAIAVNIAYFQLNLKESKLSVSLIFFAINMVTAVPLAFYLYLRRERPITQAIQSIKNGLPIDPAALELGRFKLMRRPRFAAILVFTTWFVAGLVQATACYYLDLLGLRGSIQIFLGISIVGNPLVSLLCYLFVEITSRNDMRVLEINITEDTIVFPVFRKIVFTVSFFSILLILLMVSFFYGILREINPDFGWNEYSHYIVRMEVLSGVAIGYLILITYMVARSITAPLKEVVEAMRRVREGQVTTSVHVTSTDEVGVLAKGFNLMTRGLAEREVIKGLFGRYVSAEIRDAILSGGMELGGQEVQATILFADIRGFTNLSESHDAARVVEMLNAYFTEMVKAIMSNGGVVDKFMGDAVMAIFGAPIKRPDHAQCAIKAGQEMLQRLEAHNFIQEAKGEPSFDIGIGISTGHVILGNIGSDDRKEFTVIGDTVNTAARLEGLTRSLGRKILFSEETWKASSSGIFVTDHELKGKEKRVGVYSV
ncbi:MAG: HAMP domain-containing protein, partial [Spirochaetia bacterium]|nr:HAMP domain-containing protein [Spirochaetia bacterium]